MEDHLIPLKTIIVPQRHSPEQPHLIEVKQSTRLSNKTIDSIEDALKTLQAKPTSDDLTRVLQYLLSSTANHDGFNIKSPGPAAAQLIHALVSDIVPHYWILLTDSYHTKEQNLLLRCLKSVSGVGAILARLRFCLDAGIPPKAEENLERKDITRTSIDLLNVLMSLLHKDNFVSTIWKDSDAFKINPLQRNLLWKEFISFVGGGRILSLAAEVHHFLRQQVSDIASECWIGNGNEYSRWLGRNVIYMLADLNEEKREALKSLAQLLGKSLSLGFSGELQSDA